MQPVKERGEGEEDKRWGGRGERGIKRTRENEDVNFDIFLLSLHDML